MNLHDFKEVFKHNPECFTAREFIETLIKRFQVFGLSGTADATLMILKELDRECIAFSGWQTWRIHDKQLYDFDYEVVHEHGFRASMCSMFRNSEPSITLFKQLGWRVDDLLNLMGEGELDLTIKIKIGKSEIQLKPNDKLIRVNHTGKWFHDRNAILTRISQVEAKRIISENSRLFDIVVKNEADHYKYKGV